MMDHLFTQDTFRRNEASKKFFADLSQLDPISEWLSDDQVREIRESASEGVFSEDIGETDYLAGWCSCGWKGNGTFYRHDAADLERSIARMKESHKDQHPNCDLDPTIG